MQPAIEHRIVPLSARRDLVAQSVEFQGEEYQVVKDPIALTYFHLRAEQYLVLEALKKEVSIEDLRRMLQREFPFKHVTNAQVQSLLLDLHRKALVLTTRPGQSKVLNERAAENRWNRIRATMLNPMFIKLPGWNPSAVLKLAKPLVGPLFTLPGLCLVTICFLISMASLAYQYETLLLRLPTFHQFFGWPNILFLWLTIGVTKVAHELGHAVACKRFGCRCHSIGLAFLVLSPTMYCDASDSWMLRDKWKRIYIAAAGMYVEILLSSIAIFLWLFLQPGLLQNLCLNLFFISAFSTVIFNANPLIKFDGYYILSDLLEIPNLREKSKTVIQRALVWCCGLQSQPNPFLPDRGRFLFGCYAVAAAIYGWIILFSISYGLYKMLEPYHIESLGITLAFVAVGTSLAGAVTNFVKAIQAADRQNKKMRRLFVTVFLAASLLLVVLLVPVPQIVEGPFVVEPRGKQIVSVAIEGSIEKIAVKAGDLILEGDLILRLENADIQDRIQSLEAELTLKQIDANVLDLLRKNDEFAVNEKTIAGLKEELTELRESAESLEVVAPCSGKVYTTASKKSRDADRQLQRWEGTPLDAYNKSTFLERGSEVCVIAPAENFDAVLYVGQHDRDDLNVGQSIALKCDAVPGQTLRGRVVAIAENAEEFLPPTLSNKYGGTQATTTDTLGRERPEISTYQIRIEVEDFPIQLSELRGRARVVVTHRTLYEYLVRLARQTFLFRI